MRGEPARKEGEGLYISEVHLIVQPDNSGRLR